MKKIYHVEVYNEAGDLEYSMRSKDPQVHRIALNEFLNRLTTSDMEFDTVFDIDMQLDAFFAVEVFEEGLKKGDVNETESISEILKVYGMRIETFTTPSYK